MRSKGFSVGYPLFMSMFIFCRLHGICDSQSAVVSLSSPVSFLLALMVNARHLFYGISMLDKYEHTGWKKFYLIYGMCDESFSINCTVTPPEDVDKGWFMFFVTLLNHLYWVCGSTAGALLGYVIHFDTTGIEFVMTALFVVMFMGQWEEHPDHRPALIGLVIPIVCLFVSLAARTLLFRPWY